MNAIASMIIASMMLYGMCPPGKVPAGGMATTSFIYTYACLSPEDKARLDEKFAENMCLEGGLASWGGRYEHTRSPRWTGTECKVTEEWRKDGKPITEEEYAHGTCMSLSIYYLDGTKKIVYPKPEWKECLK